MAGGGEQGIGDGGGHRRHRELADTADVVVTGYRPGALDRFGLAPEDLLERRPELVVVRLDAWGWTGPWAGRRGFDSIVQAAGGIAVACARADGRPWSARWRASVRRGMESHPAGRAAR